MSATYNGIEFDTELQAKWAAFFDLAGWSWQKGLVPIKNWKPDFRVTFECSHSECSGNHTLLVSVLPVDNLDGLRGHPALSHCYSVVGPNGLTIADAGALFGLSPNISHWEMAHGAGGGIEEVTNWVDDAHALWSKAAVNVISIS